jgi:hypothetical protein
MLPVRKVASFFLFAEEAWIIKGAPCVQLRQKVVLYLRLGMLSICRRRILAEIKFHYIGLYFYRF